MDAGCAAPCNAGYEPRSAAEPGRAGEALALGRLHAGGPWACCCRRRWCCPCWAICSASTGCCPPGRNSAGHAGAVHWLGARFLEGRLACGPALTGNMDLLVARAPARAMACRCGCGGRPRHPGHAPHLYFEASAVVITLVLLGKWLEARAKRQTTARFALRAAAEVAHLLSRGGEVDVPIAEVHGGDRLVVRPGERIPVDGVVHEGTPGGRVHADRRAAAGGARRAGGSRAGRSTAMAAS